MVGRAYPGVKKKTDPFCLPRCRLNRLPQINPNQPNPDREAQAEEGAGPARARPGAGGGKSLSTFFLVGRWVGWSIGGDVCAFLCILGGGEGGVSMLGGVCFFLPPYLP